MKMAMGLNINIPKNIWEMEVGRGRFEAKSMRRVEEYLLQVGKM